MKHIGVVVEGLGDRNSVPTLVAKTAALHEALVFVRHVVEGGGWDTLKKANELERNCRLVAADENIDAIIVLVDLEDDCAKEQSEAAAERIKAIEDLLGVPVHLCFCVREYETWFLENFNDVQAASPDIEFVKPELEDGAIARRGAKEQFGTHMGLSYRPSVDQEKFTKRLNLQNLLGVSRSFQKFSKIISEIASHQQWSIV